MAKTTVKPFHFKSFSIEQDRCSMKVGTDGILLGAWADVEGAQRILDIGTGTGLIAIMLAQRAEEAMIDAVEIEEEACRQASENMAKAPWPARLQSIHIAIQDYARSGCEPYDLIVSNPPFFSGGTFSANQDKTEVRHTVKLPHGDLLSAVRNLLTPDGKFCVVLPLIEGLRFRELARSYNLYCTKITEVYSRADKQLERLLMQFEKQEISLRKDQLILEGKNGRRSGGFAELTKDFYLDK